MHPLRCSYLRWPLPFPVHTHRDRVGMGRVKDGMAPRVVAPGCSGSGTWGPLPLAASHTPRGPCPIGVQRPASGSGGPLSLRQRLSPSSPPPAPWGSQVRGRSSFAPRFHKLMTKRVNDALRVRDLALKRGDHRLFGYRGRALLGGPVAPFLPLGAPAGKRRPIVYVHRLCAHKERSHHGADGRKDRRAL